MVPDVGSVVNHTAELHQGERTGVKSQSALPEQYRSWRGWPYGQRAQEHNGREDQQQHGYDQQVADAGHSIPSLHAKTASLTARTWLSIQEIGRASCRERV